jgi:hypothetical protein
MRIFPKNHLKKNQGSFQLKAFQPETAPSEQGQTNIQHHNSAGIGACIGAGAGIELLLLSS